jgi:hypothetical protein
MPKNLFSKTNISLTAGLLAYIVTILVLFIPFEGQPSMSLIDWHSYLGIIVITLFVLSLVLYIYGILKHDKCLSPKEALELLNKRKEYLPELKTIIENKIKEHDLCRDKASNTSIEDYSKSYFWNNHKYRSSLKRHPNNINLAFQEALFASGFITDNLLYQDLIKRDPNMSNIESKYNILFAQITDKKLKKYIKDYWWYEQRFNSWRVLEEIIKNGKYKININKLRILNTVSNKFSSPQKNKALSKIMNRIDELLDGMEDE